jgi:hypothetical protein
VTVDLGEFLAVDTPDPVSRPSKDHPSGWQPGVDTAAGTIVAPPGNNPDGPSDWDDVLRQFQLDPAKWEVVSDEAQVRTWDAQTPEGVRRFFYWRARVRPRRTAATADVAELARRIARHRYRRPDPADDVTSALVVCLADWQAGPDPQGLVDHVLAMKNAVVDRLKTENPDVLYVVGMGDLVEQCSGHYPGQTFATGAGGLNGRRDQVKLVRRLLVDLLTTWARYAPRVVAGAVAGNHGQNRLEGKEYTTPEDNDDLAVMEQAAEVLAANPDAYGHVRFVLPDGDLSLTLDIAGTVVSFIHGHQARRGASPQLKQLNWWKDKAHAQHPVGDAAVLCTGHFHHLQVLEDGPRTWFQCPALAQSRWWEEAGGAATKVGTLTFTVGPDGWDNMRVLR